MMIIWITCEYYRIIMDEPNLHNSIPSFSFRPRRGWRLTWPDWGIVLPWGDQPDLLLVFMGSLSYATLNVTLTFSSPSNRWLDIRENVASKSCSRPQQNVWSDLMCWGWGEFCYPGGSGLAQGWSIAQQYKLDWAGQVSRISDHWCWLKGF